MWAICNVIVSISPSVCSASSRASTLREASLLRMLEIVTVISSLLVASGGGEGTRDAGAGAGAGGSSAGMMGSREATEGSLARGKPSLEGSMLLGLAMPVVGEEDPGAAGTAVRRTGDAARGKLEGPGDAGREGLKLAGLAGRLSPPIRLIPAGEPGLCTPVAASRATWAGGAGSAWAGPCTRRSRSSSWVLSLAGSGPTRDHTFS
ncbi:unnamed protein product, partial [Mycena citricolor]